MNAVEGKVGTLETKTELISGAPGVTTFNGITVVDNLEVVSTVVKLGFAAGLTNQGQTRLRLV